MSKRYEGDPLMHPAGPKVTYVADVDGKWRNDLADWQYSDYAKNISDAEAFDHLPTDVHRAVTALLARLAEDSPPALARSLRAELADLFANYGRARQLVERGILDPDRPVQLGRAVQ